MPRISVILSTYNRPDALDMVLRSLAAQTYTDFEVVVADDGSREDTRLMIDRFSSQSPFKLKQVWQEDEGFRAATIRNKAVAASQGKYLVFLDGDCMVFPDFLAEHARLKEPNRFTTGNRMLLSCSFTETVLSRQLPLHQWTLSQWIMARLKGRTNRLLPLLRFPLGFLRKLTPRKWHGVKTCNLGVWRQDFLDVNGFDESYQGWGYEDSDLVIRIMNKGVFRLEGRFAIPVMHLWHPSNHSPSTEENLQRLHDVLNSNTTRVDNGVHRHMSVGPE
jgi:glycosyltransferase involved in cell wall biosynthesis